MIWNHEERAKLVKKCPFCGSSVIKTDNPEWIKEHEIEVIKIQCDECGAEVRAYTHECDPISGYREALKIWNRRAS